VSAGRELAKLVNSDSRFDQARIRPIESSSSRAPGETRQHKYGKWIPEKKLAVLESNTEILDARFNSSRAQIVGIGVDRTARIWELGRQKEIAVLKGHGDVIRSAAFSPDGKRVIAASVDETARIWDVSTGREIFILAGHGAQLTDAVFSPDGTRAVTASWDGTARIWDTATGKEIRVLSVKGGQVTSTAFGCEHRSSRCAAVARRQPRTPSASS
jgi:WD40 repeat protein